tara:strand:+ start:250 stop:555 length:306 start_codon:yes stop_codon:yes gene_type:complete
MPEEPDLEYLWESWVSSAEAEELESEVWDGLIDSVHLFDVNDGTHAGWVEDQLGVLLVFDLNEALMFSSETDEDAVDWTIHQLVFSAVEGLIEHALQMRGY